MKKTVIAYIGGGSKAWAHKYFSDLLSQSGLNGEIRLYDTDIKAAQKNKKFFDILVKRNQRKIKSGWTASVFDNDEAVLTGADFVVMSVLPGTLNNMHYDVHYPEKFGIYQSVGDTVGPGGYSRALRTIPIYMYYAEKIKKCCPQAFVINYTNPMSLCVYVLYKAFPEIKAFGCCHEVFGTQKLLAKIVRKELKIKEKIKRQDIKVNVQGINHFTWLNTAKYQQNDVFDILQKQGRVGKSIVKSELFLKHGEIAAAGDRHLVEFIPEVWLAKRSYRRYGFGLTSVAGRKFRDKWARFYRILVISRLKKPRIKPSGEEGVLQIKALLGLEPITTNVNVPNRGQCPDMPLGNILETNAVMTENSIVPVNAGEMKESVRALVLRHSENQRRFIEAYFNRDKTALFDAFYNDNAVSRLSKENAKKLFDGLIEKNKERLESWVTAK
jgi:alpha-galactosidase